MAQNQRIFGLYYNRAKSRKNVPPAGRLQRGPPGRLLRAPLTSRGGGVGCGFFAETAVRCWGPVYWLELPWSRLSPALIPTRNGNLFHSVSKEAPWSILSHDNRSQTIPGIQYSLYVFTLSRSIALSTAVHYSCLSYTGTWYMPFCFVFPHFRSFSMRIRFYSVQF